MPENVTQKLLRSHLAHGTLEPGAEIGLRIDQTLTQDATGTMVMLELEAMAVDRVKTEVSVQYVDHNLLQTDHKNPDDHLFLRSACRRFGIWYSKPGNGVSHPVHMERFGKPGKTLVGSDSHTPAAGSLGMFALGAGGIDVALAMIGEPVYLKMPAVWGVRLTGELPDWVSAKDVILEMLRRHDVDGGIGKVVEYHGPGLASLSAMDRHVIANMGTELGATTTVFPSDDAVRRFLRSQGREDDWTELVADEGAEYDLHEEIDLSTLEPLVACPSSPGNVVPVREVAGKPIYQSYIGSSANPGLRDFWVPSRIVQGRSTDHRVSFDVTPTSRQILQNLFRMGAVQQLIEAGARLHQAGCGGCIGMGQAPASNEISLRTVPRNFPGRSGTRDDLVYLVSPETAAASALTGEITDPRDLPERFGIECPRWEEPEEVIVNEQMLEAPPEDGRGIELEKGPNIHDFPHFPDLVDRFSVPVLLKVEDDVSTDEIMPAGEEVLPFRSNVPKISEFVYYRKSPGFHDRAKEAKDRFGGHVLVAGENYAQGSSREHAAIAPRYLGQIAVLAKSYARIGWQNLANFGIVPLELVDPGDYDEIEQGDEIQAWDLRQALRSGGEIVLRNRTKDRDIRTRHSLSERQVELILEGGVVNYFKEKL
ncbi:MAG TPA: aconitate hydratase [Thermoanaerobaculia bacterium]|nr:aconitate hydratase [Thermoanaerobaculia bacterium]